MSERQIGVTINGATGRMGTTQHMANLLAIAAEGGLALRNGDRLIPDLLLVGRDAGRLKALSAAKGNQRWTTNLDEALAGPDAIFMDCAATGDATMVVQMDGTLGSAVAGRFRCFTQPAVNTTEAFFGGGRPTGVDFAAQWQEVSAPCLRGRALRRQSCGRGEGRAACRSGLSQCR
jgi:hypothetical protein